MSSTSGSGSGGGHGGGGASGHRAAMGPMSSLSGSGGGGDGGEAGGGGGGGSGHHDLTQAAAISGGGGGGGVGVGGGGGDVPGRHSDQTPIAEPILFVEGRIQAYDGENEELDELESLVSTMQEPPSMDSVLKDELTVEREIVQADQYHNQLGPNDLQACLRQGEWNRTLDILTRMVRNGAAAGNAVNDEANPLDIRRTHPELVLLLRGQALYDLKRMGDTIRANAYYRNYICADYPEDSSTGVEFVDKLLAEIKLMQQGERLPRNCRFTKKNRTRKSVNDYMKVYFPKFGDVEIKKGVVAIGPFGEKQGNEVRCLACHDFKRKKFSERKLYYHQLQDSDGRQTRCPASTKYIRKEIRDVVSKKDAATTAHSPPQAPQDDAHGSHPPPHDTQGS